jgi:hypothetical protein
MVLKWLANPIALLALGLSTAVQAADPVPDRVATFVAYCPTHFADCKSKVIEADVAVMATILFAKKGTQACAIPKGVDESAATKQILAWLGEHNDADAMKTEDGIQAAVKNLWHCKTQIGDGTVPGGPPAKTGPFVAYCASHYTQSANEMVAISVSIMATEHSKHCSPPAGVGTRQMTTAVLAWLGQHKENDARDANDGIAIAFDHLWPCH